MATPKRSSHIVKDHNLVRAAVRIHVLVHHNPPFDPSLGLSLQTLDAGMGHPLSPELPWKLARFSGI